MVNPTKATTAVCAARAKLANVINDDRRARRRGAESLHDSLIRAPADRLLAPGFHLLPGFADELLKAYQQTMQHGQAELVQPLTSTIRRAS